MKTNFILVGFSVALAIDTHASISEPPNIFYGDVIIDNEALTSADTHYTVLAKLNGEVLDSYKMGSSLTGSADKYIIRVPVSTIDNGLGVTAQEGDLVDFYVSTPSSQDVWIASATVGTRGLIRDLQLGAIDNNGNSLAAKTENCANNASICLSSINQFAAKETPSATQQDAATSTGSPDTTVNSGHTDVTTLSSAAVMLKAWVGHNDTQVDLPESVLGFEFYRSSEADCRLDNYISCEQGQMDVVNGLMVNDTAADLQQPGYYHLQTAGLSSSLTLDAQAPSAVLPKDPESVVSFDNKLWMITTDPESTSKLLWSSSDGIAWQEQPVSGFVPSDREAYGFVNFADRLWLIAGTSNDGQLHNDIWSSADGLNWRKEPELAEFSPRENPHLLHFNNQLWLLGGQDESGSLSDLWSSRDGLTWEQQEAPDFLSDRVDYQVLSFNDRLWLIGGEIDGVLQNDIWTSTDGKQWAQQRSRTAFSPRSEHRVVHFDNRLWLIGGWDGDTYLNDLWSSTDGLHWSETENTLPFFLPHDQYFLVFDEQLWRIGTKDASQPHEIWSSDTGMSWRKGVRSWFFFR